MMKADDDSALVFLKENTVFCLLVILVIPVLFGCFAVTTSFEHGRWSRDLEYDDLSYYLQGVTYAEEIRANGASGALEHYLSNPVRAPFSVFLATAGFLIFGYTEWAPLAANFVVLIGTAAVTLLFFSWRHRWQGLLAVVAILMTSTLYEAAEQFRPDYAYSLVLAFACGLLFRMIAERRDELSWWAGVAVGGAFVVKTSTLPLTIVMIGSTVCLGLWALGWRPWKLAEKRIAGRQFGSLIKAFSVTALIALPLYLPHGKTIILYIWNVVFDEKESAIWRIDLNVWDRLMAYLNGPWAWQMALPQLWCWLSIVAIGLLVSFLSSRDKVIQWRLIHWMVMILIAYAVVTINGEKTAFLGLPFFVVSMVGALEACAGLFSFGNGKLQRIGFAIPVILIFAISISAFKPSRFAPTWHERGEGHGSTWKEANRRIIDRVADPSQSSQGVPCLYVASPATFDSPQLTWVAFREKKDIRIFDDRRVEGIDHAISMMFSADYVLACSQESLNQEPRFPSDFLADEVLSFLRSSSQFQEIERFEVISGCPYFLFRRVELISIEWGDGFSETESEGGARWRWAGRSGYITIENSSNEPIEIQLSVTLQMPDSTAVKVTWPGKDVAPDETITLKDERLVEQDLGRITLSARETKELHFQFKGDPFAQNTDPRTLCFRVLQLKLGGQDFLNDTTDSVQSIKDRLEAIGQ